MLRLIFSENAVLTRIVTRPHIMKTKRSLLSLFLIVCAIPCFAGEIKGSLVSDEMVAGFFIYLFFAHFLGILAFYFRVVWLRVLSGLIYLPVLAIPVLLFFLHASFGLLLIPTLAFFVFLIVRRRKGG